MSNQDITKMDIEDLVEEISVSDAALEAAAKSMQQIRDRRTAVREQIVELCDKRRRRKKKDPEPEPEPATEDAPKGGAQSGWDAVQE